MKSDSKSKNGKQENTDPNIGGSSPNDDVLVSLTTIIFEQVKLQQEVRDRWFEHYIAIIGAISALATLCLGLFSDSMQTNILLLLVSVIFLLASFLGVLFYVLYLNQRYNYKRNYKLLSALEGKILKKQIGNDLKTFTTRKHGADFITLLIENVICAACFTASICFFTSGLSLATPYIVTSGIAAFALCILILQIIYNRWERKG